MPNLVSPIPPLKIPGKDYRQEDFIQLVRQITNIFNILRTQGDIIGTELRLTACPRSGYGLPPGGVYADENNHLILVEGDEAFSAPFTIMVTLIPPTVTTF